MDAKSLEALRKLRQSMDAAEETGPDTEKPKSHPRRQGFSDESEKFFIERAKSRIGAAAKSEYPERPGPSQEDEAPVIDRVTRALRQEFAALNKQADLRESAENKALERNERRLTKAARRRARKADKAAKVAKETKKSPSKSLKTDEPARNASKRTKPPAPEPTSKWVESICWRCKSKMVIHADWVDPPGLCNESPLVS
jgi:hypothetical protein